MGGEPAGRVSELFEELVKVGRGRSIKMAM